MATIIDVFSIIGNKVVRETNHGESGSYQDTTSLAIDARVSVYTLGENHPLASVFGAFDDEPMWDDWMKAITEYRQESNAKEETEE